MTNARPSFVSPRGAPSIDMAFSMVQDDSNNSSSSSSASQFATMFRQALTTAVSCGSTTSTTTHGKGSIFSDLDCLGLLTTAPKKRSRPDARRRRRGVTTVADQEARKILSLLSEQLSASKAILLDAETISILLERLLA